MIPEVKKEFEEKKFIYYNQFSEHIMRFKNPELGFWNDIEVVPKLHIYTTENISAEIETAVPP